MTRRAGLTTSRHSWHDPFRRPGVKRAPAAPLTEDQQRQRAIDIEASTQEFLAQMAARSAPTGLSKLVDREARVAVEGDTDMNHDNVEAAPVDHYARDTADLDRTRVLLANCIMNCGTRIYQGDHHLVMPPNDEFYCAECAKAEAAE